MKSKTLTLQFIPYQEIEGLSSVKRVAKLLRIVKSDKIVLLEGKLKSHEEADLIRRTMEEIDAKFKGIEISVIDTLTKKEDMQLFEKLRKVVLGFILGARSGFTIIGPATIVKEIRQDPDKIQLFMSNK
ncbi:MAG: DUF2073 domain-containing protein [Candidatus Woesearchaeota archaeon]|nr:MAG: DUF2073 domain-containing protein [Candidatus Woesearchaeota archaeon]